jgi:hypothetical protein
MSSEQESRGVCGAQKWTERSSVAEDLLDLAMVAFRRQSKSAKTGQKT